jgi:sugar phosphate isomerase/epimerase
MSNDYPKLHNAMWPGLVGKGSPGAEPCIDLDTMLDLTTRAEVNGVKFEGVDLFLFDPHVSIDIDEEGLERLADKVQSKGLVVGSVVAPVWGATGGGSAMGTDEERKRFVDQVRKACRIASRLRELGARPYGVVRIDSACGVAEWAADPAANQAKIAQTFREACEVAEGFGERLAAEGEICWGGMHSWKRMVELLKIVDRPQTLGFQADMAHTLLYALGYNAPDDALLPAEWDWSDPAHLNEALKTLTDELRPWTIDFHVAQNDATVKGSGTHDKTGHHCLPGDPNGKLSIAHHARYWLRTEDGNPTRATRHICWDGCMFPNSTMMQPETWNDILNTMIAVREAHGWVEETAPAAPTEYQVPSFQSKVQGPKARAKSSKSKVQRPRTKAKAKGRKTKARGRKPKAKARVRRTRVARKRVSRRRPAARRKPTRKRTRGRK